MRSDDESPVTGTATTSALSFLVVSCWSRFRWRWRSGGRFRPESPL